jgi:hypothetical protein
LIHERKLGRLKAARRRVIQFSIVELLSHLQESACFIAMGAVTSWRSFGFATIANAHPTGFFYIEFHGRFPGILGFM